MICPSFNRRPFRRRSASGWPPLSQSRKRPLAGRTRGRHSGKTFEQWCHLLKLWKCLY